MNLIVGARTHISVPNLIFLKLTDIWHYTPLFEAMPSLEVGYVSLGEDCLDYCNNNKSWGCDNVDCGFGCTDGYKYDSILLEGLSNASYLELLSEPSMVCLHFLGVPIAHISLLLQSMVDYPPIELLILFCNLFY